MNTHELYNKAHFYLKLDKENILESQISEIENIIGELANIYYNQENPIISDSEYDELLKKLEFLEEKFFITNKKSEKVGSDVNSKIFKKVKHSRPMISLGNTYNEEDLKDFDERINRILGKNLEKEYMIEFKFDGLGVELIYKNGNLVQAITRGNGIEGEDVTNNILEIKNIPKKINYLEDIEIRGEVLMPISSFQELNKKAKYEGTKIFSNPRNAASGSLRVLDSQITRERNLKFFAYDIGDFENFGFNYYQEIITELKNLGFEISSYFEKSKNIEEVIQKIQNFGDTKKNIDFEIDGLVIKINDIKLWKKIGYTEHHPRYAIAYKFPAELVTTRIEHVEHSVGRTGTITPVAFVSPVNIGGAIIQRSTLHNYDEIEKLGIKLGDFVFIKRAGEVIPKIVSVIENARNGEEKEIGVPEFCPSCGEKVQKDEDKVRYYCPNSENCPSQKIEKFAYIVGKNGFDIDGFGIKQMELFLQKGFIEDMADIFLLSKYKNKILELEGYQEKSVNNLLQAIENKKNMSLEIFLRGIAIPGVGKKTAKIISHIFESKEDILGFNKSQEDLENIQEIGPELAKNICFFFENKKDLLKKLLENINIIFPEKIKSDISHEFYNKKICITGSFENYKREELAEMLEKKGGVFVSSVSKNTDFLLAGEKAGSKLKKAEELGIKILNLESFLEKIN